MERIATVIVGGGTIAQTHAAKLLASPTCRLVAIIDPFETGRRLASQLSVDHYDSLQGLLDCRPKDNNKWLPQIYMVCVPSALHVEVATEILNKHAAKVIMVEKPFCTDAKTGEKLLALAHERNIKITTGHHRRFHPVIAAAKKTLMEGSLGHLTAISSLWTCKKNDRYYVSASWRASRQHGGGPVLTNLVHDVDVLQYLVGARVIRLWATKTTRRRSHPEVEPGLLVEEGAAVMVQFENGVVGTLVLADNVVSPYSWEQGTGENVGIAKAPFPVDCYRLFGTSGTLSVPDGALWSYRQDEVDRSGLELGWGVPVSRQTVVPDPGEPYERQIEHLGRLASGQDEEPICSGRDGLAAVKVCEAIIQALESPNGDPVAVSS